MPNTFLDNKNASVNYMRNQEEDKLDFIEILSMLSENKWLIVLTTVVVLIIGTATAFIIAPVYQVDVMLQVEQKTLSPQPLFPGEEKGSISALTEIQLIKSRMILGTAVKNLNLEIVAEPVYFPVIGEAIARYFEKSHGKNEVSSALLGLNQYALGGEAIHIDTFTVPSNLLGEEFILIAGKQGRYRLMYDDKDKGELVLVMEGEVGKMSTKQLGDASEPMTLFVSLLRARPDTQFRIQRLSLTEAIKVLSEYLVVGEKDKDTGIIGVTLQSTNPVKAQKTLNEIANIYIRQNIEQKSAEAQKTLEFLEKQLPLLKEQVEASTSALNSYRTFKGSVDLDKETQDVLTGVVELKTQLTLLQQNRDELRTKFTQWHPSVITVEKQIARLQEQINSHHKQIEVLPETQQVILGLSADVKVNTELYNTLINNAQTLRVTKAGTVGNVRVVDYAELPGFPIKPSKTLFVILSFFGGIILGIGLAFVRKMLYRGVENPDLIEQQLNVPVYATIPHSKQQAKLSNKLRKSSATEPSILALEQKDDLAIESLRSLRTTLHFAFLEAQNNIIMITGPSPSIGKSFVSINLATVLADAGKKILLIDGDLRKGIINTTLGISREQGLSELISNSISLDAAVHKIPMANFDFIATGAIPPNPSELLLHERFSTLLTNISKLYDHVIIDSPPLLAVTDAAIIGRMASVTLMVVKAGQHPMRELEQSAKRLIQAGVQLKGVVFNDVPETSSIYGYGGYGRYVYQYSYQKSS
ncbi:MAG: polysaccharide biosynthesis tyrosine autokinase [Methylococcales bacterium]|nr:polysaccharide biosynthesis tyrosine autokinase [Methylococcales bacterium]